MPGIIPKTAPIYMRSGLGEYARAERPDCGIEIASKTGKVCPIILRSNKYDPGN
jgi:hypothetical protein